MCTLIIGDRILGPGSVLLAANRDEDPGRPSDPPGVLDEGPRIVGGRDRVAGGTWLAIRERRAMVAMLNRRERESVTAPAAERRSRGLVTLDVARAGAEASAGEPVAEAALVRAREIAASGAYAPFSLAFLSPEGSWVLAHEPGASPSVTPISPGWHVLTHADLDDPGEPRTARLMRELSGWTPRTVAEAERGLIARLSEHDAPAVCIHAGRMVTVSSSIVVLGPSEGRYLHAEGRPCERPFEDLSRLLAPIGTPTRVA